MNSPRRSSRQALRCGRAPGRGKPLEGPEAELPGFVSVAPYRFLSPEAYGAGFLGPKYAPLVVGENSGFAGLVPGGADYADSLKVKDLARPRGVKKTRAEARIELFKQSEADFIKSRGGAAESHATAYQRALRLMASEAAKAFDLTQEKDSLRDSYGRNLLGQGCLLARRLVEEGVPFVEVTLSQAEGVQGLGWDSHQDNFNSVKSLSKVLDPAWATLLSDLDDRGLLDSTLVLWMGEFGRTPKINGNTGRDHWSRSWSTVMAGGGIKGGQVVGKTSDDGTEVTDRPVDVADLLATACVTLGLDPARQNDSGIGRPIRLVDLDAEPIQEVLS